MDVLLDLVLLIFYGLCVFVLIKIYKNYNKPSKFTIAELEILKSIDKRLDGMEVNVNNIDCRLMKLMDEE